MELIELTQLKSSEIKELREAILIEQDYKCAICNKDINETTIIALDHKHATNKDILGEDNKGLIRGVLCLQCNNFLGKLENGAKRFQVKDLRVWLNSAINYIEKEHYPYIHPTEKKKEPLFKKSIYNKLVKYMKNDIKNKKKIPEYPKSKKITKEFQKLLEKYSLEN